VASASQGGKIEVRLDKPDGELLGAINVAPTGGWQAWSTIKAKMKKSTGIHDICFVFNGGDGELFNFDWWMLNGK
jgi:arabinoxylan arabinofuranohydrolase